MNLKRTKIVILWPRDKTDDKDACCCSSIALVLDCLLQLGVKSFLTTCT